MKRKKNVDITTFFPKRVDKESGNSSTPIVSSTQNSSPSINIIPSTNVPPSHENESVTPSRIHQEASEATTPSQTHQPSFSSQTHQEQASNHYTNSSHNAQTSINKRLTQYDVHSLPPDPAKRKPLSAFHKDDRDIVRREYIQRGPCQPILEKFPATCFSGKSRRFSSKWYEKFQPWLEYSVDKDAVFCLTCYLFKSVVSSGGDAFVNGGYRTWCKTDSYDKHVGGLKSAHNLAVEKRDNFNNQKTSITACFSKQTSQISSAYRIRLGASIDALKYITLQGLASRGHDESEKSLNRGNFIELVKVIAKNSEEVEKVVLENAPQNCKTIAPSIQKEIINAFAKETTKKIIDDINGDFFSILADESADIVDKEQLALCLRYVSRDGKIKERFVGIAHVADTTADTLKTAIESLLLGRSLSLSKVRGQGYDGASNMSGCINGLKTLIMRDSPSAYYVHCFVHQLQLTLVAVCKKNDDCRWLFDIFGILLNLVGSSPKRKEILRAKRATHIEKALELGELETGTGLNQETTLSRPGDTRWGSYLRTIGSVLDLFPTLLDVLHAIGDAAYEMDKFKADSITFSMESFHFVFVAHLMLMVFGITNELNLALQSKSQDIVNAMDLVDATRSSLKEKRENGWNSHVEKVVSFCEKHKIDVVDWDDKYVPRGRSKRGGKEHTNFEHFRRNVYIPVLDHIIVELDDRFDKTSKELLICMSSFKPNDQFSSFNVAKLIRLAEFYPNEFPRVDLMYFEYQLETFIHDVRNDERFSKLETLNELSVKLVETKKHLTHAKVYKLLKLVLLLPVATANVERAFSAMTYIKNKLRNSMGDQLLNDNLVCFLERDVFLTVSDDDTVENFQNMRSRRIQIESV